MAQDMTPQDLRAWQAHMGMTYDTAAQQLGVARSTYARWVAVDGHPPPLVGLACSALAAGLPPWSVKRTFRL